MTDRTRKERQKRKNELDRAKGIIPHSVRIPIERIEDHKKLAAEWRAQKTLDKPGNED